MQIQNVHINKPSNNFKSTDDCCNLEEILSAPQSTALRKVFWIVFFLNLAMFGIEFISGLTASSSALLADSLDMLADAFVYGVSLVVLTKNELMRVNASLLKGFLMLSLGFFVVTETTLKIFSTSVPQAETISLVGLLAIGVNGISLLLLFKHRSVDLNVRSAWICSRNDVIANIAVIAAGILVGITVSKWPDMIVGLGMSLLVLKSSFMIVRDALDKRKALLIEHSNHVRDRRDKKYA